MEIPLDLVSIEPFSSQGFCVRLTSSLAEQLDKNDLAKPIIAAIDKLACESSKAQQLKHVLTSFKKLISSPTQILYLLWDAGREVNQSFLLGFLKVERRTLYVYDDKNVSHKRQPLCLLDFFVHEKCQHRGYGRLLLDAMLHDEHVLPCMLAVDKPSESLLSFLSKRYNLHEPKWQINNFVIYPRFFDFEDNLSPNSNGNGAVRSKPDVVPEFLGPASKRHSIEVVEEHKFILSDEQDVQKSKNGHDNDDVVVLRHFDHPDPLFALEKAEDQPDSLVVESDNPNAGSYAKGRKLLAMAHHKLW